MKVLKPSEWNALKTKADGWDAVIASIVEQDESINADELTADTVIQMLNASIEDPAEETTTNDPEQEDPAEEPESEPTNDTALKEKLEQKEEQIKALEQELESFKTAASADPASIAPKSEPGATEMDLVKFADANAGDTHSILSRLKEEGII